MNDDKEQLPKRMLGRVLLFVALGLVGFGGAWLVRLLLTSASRNEGRPWTAATVLIVAFGIYGLFELSRFVRWLRRRRRGAMRSNSKR